MSTTLTTPVELVGASDMAFAEEEHAVLLVRLRAVTLLLSAGLAMFLLRDLTFGEGPAWQFQAAATFAMAFLATLLSASLPGTTRGLRMVEVAAIGLTAGVVAVRLWYAQLSGTARGDAASLAVASRNAVIGTTILLFTYSLLIPARGHAWRLIAVIAACPAAAEVLLFLAHPEVFRLARRVATLQRVGETVSLLVIVALLAGYGAYLANTMRVRARDARQFNQYRLRDEIADGGMGEVYLAEHRSAEATLRHQGDPTGTCR